MAARGHRRGDTVTETTPKPWFEAAFGEHYPGLYAHRDEAEARRCLDLLPRLAPLGSGPVLDLGCGQGRHLQLLGRGGRKVLGLDLSWPLLRRARGVAPAQPLIRADMRRIPLRASSCSAVLSLFTAFGYFGTVAAHLPVVQGVARVLQPGGHWYLDYLDCERVATELATGPVTRTRNTADLTVREARRLEPGPRRVIKIVTLQPRPGCEAAAAAAGVGPDGLDYAEEVVLFSLAELDELAAAGGLERVAAAGSYGGSPLVVGDNDRWLLVYRRPTRTEASA